jgi:hypothetical protein
MAEEKDQNYQFSRFLNFAGWIFSLVLDPNDMISLYQAKKLLKISPFIYNNVTSYLSDNNAANAIFLAVNLAVVAYEYIYATWFLYLVTTVSGIKKLYRVIFQNPILGIFFYFSFYFRLLGETDKEKFDRVARAFDLPIHEDFLGSKFLGDSIDKISMLLSDSEIHGYKIVLKNLVRKVFSEQVVASKIEGLSIKIDQVLGYTVKNEDKIMREIQNAAVYINSRTIETQRDLDEFSEYVTVNRRDIEREIKEQIGKKKSHRKLRLQQMVEQKTPEGDVICLDVCKPRVETAMGCYCEGDCGTTMFIGGSSWCYVDPEKCKKGKYLEKYMGKTFDRCDGRNVTLPKCFTGLRYKDCQIK